MKFYQEFFAELKRRRVFRVAGIYGLVSFGVLQAADLMLPRLGLPDWTVTFMVAIVVLAFPVALLLAWAFDLTPEGLRRTDDPEPGEIEEIISAPASQRWPAGLLALVGVALLVASTWWIARRTAPETGDNAAQAGSSSDIRLAFADPADDQRPSIAVLPFADMSPDGDQEYFSDGMTEEILNVLVKIGNLRVAARTSTFALKERELTALQWGDTLRVRFLVEGSVRKAGDQVRITAQLIDTADGSHLWSESYTRPLVDVFQIQAEIAEAIAGALTVPLGLDDASDLVSPTADLEAYDLYLAGRTHMRRRGLALVEAKRLFEAAVARDSNWAPAWAALAEVSEVRIWYSEALGTALDDGQAIAATLDEAERAARKALELDARSASAYVALGSVQRDRGQWLEAEASYREALQLDPDFGEAYMQYAELLLILGRIEEGVVAADRATVLDPAPVRFFVLGWALLMDDRADETLAVLQLAVERDTDGSRADIWGDVGDRYLDAGLIDRAIEAYGKVADSGRALGYAQMLNQPPPSGEEIAAYARGIAAGDLGRVPASMRASLVPEHWLMLGEPDSAIASVLWISGLGPSGNVAWELWSPQFDSLRADPRLAAFMKERGLENERLRRTPPAQRRLPMALRTLGAEAAP